MYNSGESHYIGGDIQLQVYDTGISVCEHGQVLYPLCFIPST